MKSLSITKLDELDYSSNEAMNTLCTNLSFAGDNIKKIMITSCRPQEGKSHISINLMRSLASIGRSVVLVDADLRKSIMVGRYGIKSLQNIIGLSHYLAGMCSINDVIYQTNIPKASMILAGQDVINSLPLLSTPRLADLLDDLARNYDVVLIDTPPVGILIDSAEIAKFCDGVVFVVGDEEINRRELRDAQAQIEKAGCPILGAVMNKIDLKTRNAKKYYNRAYYNHYSNIEDSNNNHTKNKPRLHNRNKQKEA